MNARRGEGASSPEKASQQWCAFLERFPDTATVDLISPDLVGTARGKRLSTTAFDTSLKTGLGFASTVYALDTTGANVDASGLVWEEGDADRPCRIDLDTLAPVPWRQGAAQVLAGLDDHDGSPFFADPRQVLRHVTARFEPLGLRPVCALELEFYLVERSDGPTPQPPAGADGIQVYSLDRLDAQAAFFERLRSWSAQQNLPAKSAVSEYAPGQFEVNLGHVGDPLRAADDAFMLKRAIRAAARADGLDATFMAKPFADLAANGLHIHVSLVDQDGGNRFATDPATLEQAIAGLQATMAEAMLVFAPNANSYRRFRPLSYAPMAPSWGHNNRTVALRIPKAPPHAQRIEHRVAGADANPYLVLAAVLAGMHHGITQGLRPDAPIRGNAYTQVAPSLPTTWDRAIEAWTAATIMPAYLGPRFCRLYGVCRAAERDRFADIVTATEHAWYLRTV